MMFIKTWIILHVLEVCGLISDYCKCNTPWMLFDMNFGTIILMMPHIENGKANLEKVNQQWPRE